MELRIFAGILAVLIFPISMFIWTYLTEGFEEAVKETITTLKVLGVIIFVILMMGVILLLLKYAIDGKIF